MCVGLAWCLWSIVRWLCRWRNLKRLAIGCGCLLLLLILLRVEENWRGKRAWDNFRREWEAKGEKFDFKAFVPPPVPADQNFALTPIVASCYGNILDTNGNRICPPTTNVVNRLELRIYGTGASVGKDPTNGSWSKGTLTDLRGWQEYYQSLLVTNESGAVTHEFPVPTHPQTPGADVLLALGKYDDALKELAAASRLPASRFPLNYDSENPAAILLPHLSAMKMCAQTLQLRALAELEAGQSAQACEDTVLIFQLTEKFPNDPLLIDHLVRIAMMQIAVQAVYEGLAAHRWTEADLVKLSAEIDRQNLAADYQFTMRGEMAESVKLIDYWKKNPGELWRTFLVFQNLDAPHSPPWYAPAVARLIPPGWFDQNKVNYCRLVAGTIIPIANETNRTFSMKMYRQWEDRMGDYTPWAPFHFLHRMLVPALGASTRKFALCQTALNLADTAIALEHYRLVKGNYPETLDVLAPQFIAQLPTDPIGGKMLKYRREAGGQFVLYSVGWNETDDGGVTVFREFSPNTVDMDKGDWVWRYPGK